MMEDLEGQSLPPTPEEGSMNDEDSTINTGQRPRTRSGKLGYMHLTDEQFTYLDETLAHDVANRHARVVDFVSALSASLFLVPFFAAAEAFDGGSWWDFYQQISSKLVIAVVGEAVLAVLYDSHSHLFSYVGRLSFLVKALNFAWIMFILFLPIGSVLALHVTKNEKSAFGYILCMLGARFVTGLLVWVVRSQPRTWKHDVGPRFPVMIRSLVDCSLLFAALLASTTVAGYLTALGVLAGPIVTYVLVQVCPIVNFD